MLPFQLFQRFAGTVDKAIGKRHTEYLTKECYQSALAGMTEQTYIPPRVPPKTRGTKRRNMSEVGLFAISVLGMHVAGWLAGGYAFFMIR